MPYPNYTPKEIMAYREADLIHTLLMNDDDCLYWMRKEEEARQKPKVEKKIVVASPSPISDLGDWPRFYREVLGMTPDFSGLVIPRDPGGYGWIVPVAKGFTANRLWAACQKRFPCYSYAGDDLDKAVPTHERTAKQGSYIIRVRDRREADKELKNRSANWIAEQKQKTMTFIERLLLELWYSVVLKPGKHLDIHNITLCAGSRVSDGGVPCVDWRDGRLCVDWRYPDSAHDGLRARSAVS